MATLDLEKLQDFRQRVLAGENIPPEEVAEALHALRAARGTAATPPAKKSQRRTPEEEKALLDSLLGGQN